MVGITAQQSSNEFPTFTATSTLRQLREAVQSFEAQSSTNAMITKLPLTTSRMGAIVVISLLFLFSAMISSYRDLRELSPSSHSLGERDEDEDIAVLEAFQSYDQNAPLFDAVISDDIELVRTLLTHGIDEGGERTTFYNVNAEDEKGITPLIEATLLGNVQLVNLLLLHGARSQPLPGFRHTPLRAACLTGNVQLIKLLLGKGADPNAMSEGGRTPLMGACYLRPLYDESPDRIDLSYRAVNAMLADPRTDPSIENDFGETALDLCRERLYNKSMALLRDRPAVGKVRTRNKKGGRLRKKKYEA